MGVMAEGSVQVYDQDAQLSSSNLDSEPANMQA